MNGYIYNVYMKMESGATMMWRGIAEDANHAEGMAIAWATSSGDQVYDSDMEEEAV
jgi:hypothetical protein